MSHTITVIGLGAGDLEQLPLGVYRLILNQDHLYVRTKDHPVIEELIGDGHSFTFFDSIYEQHETFEAVYDAIVAELLEAAKSKEILYAVPGHPLVAERTVQLLLAAEREGRVTVKILGGQSFLDPMFSALRIDPVEGCQVLDGTMLSRDEVHVTQHIVICQVYDQMIASHVKLTLMELLPDDYEVTVATAVGTKNEKLETVPLYELDRVTTISNLTAVYVPPVEDEVILYQDFRTLRQIIATLRGPDGCPWDKKQTHQSLKKYLLEEAYEVLEAIDEENEDHLVEELGDLLLQVLLHAQIGEDDGWFQIEDVIRSISEKMIRRHPHVFGERQVEDAEDVVETWDEIKKAEKGEDQASTSILGKIPKGLPSLMLAFELQKKAAKVGFDWAEVEPMWAKLDEELHEFKEEIQAGHSQEMAKEFGDVLFVLVNIGRFYNIYAEEALHRTNEKFKRRFQSIEQAITARGGTLEESSLEEMDVLWNQAKESESQGE
ncbi:nucleoside triphosphate pyrophosphohydrolase [Halalkalibacterium halodurans]|uniref:nucleoside triphosphate pyrophosphohydrolase n=1 Tax=Halalkalibacterium halodurans TaxID=86665 RepID=UPI002E21CC58|nr:nucleoside triphosphate pyrophosphohydrolase [Halalkalibacterium halodurans]